MRTFKTLYFTLGFLPLPLAVFGMESLSAITLNMHGYHPMGEAERFFQNRTGMLTPAPSSIHYFKPLEITKGNTRRLNELANNMHSLSPDIIFLQEVGAGAPHISEKTCQDFYAKFSYDYAFENTSLRLEKKLDTLGNKYQSLLACRGNLGWFTGPSQFIDERIVTKDGQIIFDFYENPYPSGVLIEGSSIMVSKQLRVLDHLIINDPYNRFNHTFFYQMAALSDNLNNWFLVINIHAGHKMAHFEQSILIRKNILNYLNNHKHKGTFIGVLIAGDFNARLFRPISNGQTQEEFSEVSTIFYEIKKPGQFDFYLDNSNDHHKIEMLKQELIKLNESNFKPWASVLDKREFELRLNDAISEFTRIQKKYQEGSHHNVLLMQSSLEMANEYSLCKPDLSLAGACSFTSNIDFIMHTGDFNVINSYVIFSINNWTSLDSVSDHPGIYTKFSYPSL